MTPITRGPFAESDDIGFLREAVLFRDMPDDVIRAVAAQATTVTYNSGEVVVKRGGPGARAFVVKKGMVKGRRPHLWNTWARGNASASWPSSRARCVLPTFGDQSKRIYWSSSTTFSTS